MIFTEKIVKGLNLFIVRCLLTNFSPKFGRLFTFCWVHRRGTSLHFAFDAKLLLHFETLVRPIATDNVLVTA